MPAMPSEPEVTTSSILRAQTSRFLTIPGEIRNRVYQYAVEDANAWQYKDFANIADPRKRENELAIFRKLNVPCLHPLSTVPSNQNTAKRAYLGLTQVCQQLRAEFLPLHSRTWVRVSLNHLPAYFRTVVAKQTNKVESTTASIEVMVTHYGGARTEILSIVRAYNMAPSFELRFTAHDRKAGVASWPDGIHPALEPILLHAKTQYPRWWGFLCTRVQSLYLSIKSCQRGFSTPDSPRSVWVHGLLVKISSGCDDGRMAKAVEVGSRAWLKDMGFPSTVGMTEHRENVFWITPL